MTLLGTSAGDKIVVDRLRQQLGLDLPLQVQYWRWISNVLRADFGYSFANQQSVRSLLAANFPATIQLTIAALTLSLTLGMLLGIAAALQPQSGHRYDDDGVRPILHVDPELLARAAFDPVFAVTLPWFDVVGGTSFKGLVLPAVTLAAGSMGFNARFIRSSIIAAQVQKHVITARAKGITRYNCLLKHVLRNALLPILTIVGLQVGQLLSGTVIVETVFSRPGVGRLLVRRFSPRTT